MKPTHPGPESVILALLVARDVVVRVASVPAELVLFVRGDIHVLEVSVGLLPVAGGAIALLGKLVALRVGVGCTQRRANRKYRLEKKEPLSLPFYLFLHFLTSVGPLSTNCNTLGSGYIVRVGTRKKLMINPK